MKKHLKKSLSFLLVLCMLFSLISTGLPIVSAEETTTTPTTPTVEIVSLFRGAQTDLRSSELLEAKVTGYTGNVRELTYKWTNSLGTYLYVYNSHNMYNINNTDGEVEIHNTEKNLAALSNMTSRSSDQTFTGKGYMWAAVYGADLTTESLVGTITVDVIDSNGNVICSDSHTGSVETTSYWWWATTTKKGFVDANLDDDMDKIAFGIFEGDTRDVKDLLGESAIVHITCVESTVSNGSVKSGGEYISLDGESPNYTITGIKPGSKTSDGDAKVNLTITKGNCKFHKESSGTATTTVYVYRKPTPTPTTTTITLAKDSLDKRCTYSINGVYGTKLENGDIIFEGLTPNTTYEIEVTGKTEDTAYAYAYVYSTTLPVFTATVNTMLMKVDSTESVAENLTDMFGANAKVALKKDNQGDFIELTQVKDSDGNNVEGSYSANVEPGTYFIYVTKDGKNYIGNNQELTIANDNRERQMLFYEVEYDLNGGESNPEIKTEYYLNQETVTVSSVTPTKDNYAFVNWKEHNSTTTHNPSAVLTYNITKSYRLVAQYEKTTNVFVNLKIYHTEENGSGTNNDANMHNVFYTVDQKATGSTGDYTEIYSETLTWDGKAENHPTKFNASYTEQLDIHSTLYDNYSTNTPVLADVPLDRDYTVTITKSGYYLKSVTTEKDENDNIILYAEIIYDPTEANLTFEVELDDAAKKLDPAFKPVAANVKITAWHDPTDNGVTDTHTWHTFTRHEHTYERVPLDATSGKGTGNCLAWIKTTGENPTPYYYRIEVVSFELPDGTVMAASDVENEHTTYTTDDERYTAKVSVTDGADPDGEDANVLTGAYFKEVTTDGTTKAEQQGDIKAVISVEFFNVTFDPDGGTLNGTTKPTTLEKQFVAPDTKLYVPTRDGGYVFDNWYLVNEDKTVEDNPFDPTNYVLKRDITLIAKWKAPRTIDGTIAIATTYPHEAPDGTVHAHKIHECDRATKATVVLQRIYPQDNNYYFTVSTIVIPITYNPEDAEVGTGKYEFTNVPDDGYEYRINVLSPNYSGVFQHAPDSMQNPTAYDNYNSTDFTAVFDEKEPTIATVNAYLNFDPHNFKLLYEIDANAIGKSCRPKNAGVLVLYDDGTKGDNPQNWSIISQMYQNEIKSPQTTAITDGKGNDSYPVWRYKSDGVSLYDYAVLFDNYDDTEFVANKAPFIVHYNGSARYSPAHDAQTQLLTMVLAPRAYTVHLNLGFEETTEDFVTNMADYRHVSYDANNNAIATYSTTHIWSYDTDINKIQPIRKGYKFLGWYDINGNKVTTIDATVHENVELTAKWEGFKVTFYNNNPEFADDTIFRTYYPNDVVMAEDIKLPEGATLPEENAMKLTDSNTIESFYDIPEFEYATHNKYIFKGWYLDKDTDTRPINWSTVYTEDTPVYAHWIKVDTVKKEDDGKAINMSEYSEYDLLGVQIRTETVDDIEHYETVGTGLRFVSVLSESVYSQIDSLYTTKNTEYGFVVANSKAIPYLIKQNSNYKFEYNGESNGKDMSNNYVDNIKCSGVPDHYQGTNYRLYTAVITYDGITGEQQLTKAQNTKLTARAYIRYYDANGLYRSHYNNYVDTKNYGGCSVSYTQAYEALTGNTVYPDTNQ